MGMDQYWRSRVTNSIPKKTPLLLLDLATGTGDQVLSILKKHPEINAIGIDTAEGMLKKACHKAQVSLLHTRVSFELANAMQLPFPNHSFDILTTSFGIRNIPCIQSCFKELYRVLKPGGTLLILEFSLPKQSWLKSIYLLYLRHILPAIGKLISKHKTAYTYLNQTIETFPYGDALCSILDQEGFDTTYTTYTLGVVTLYVSKKPPLSPCC